MENKRRRAPSRVFFDANDVFSLFFFFFFFFSTTFLSLSLSLSLYT